MTSSNARLISFATQADDPFQFISKVVSYREGIDVRKIPVTQDASASAYQIMSYLLLNTEMARRTNLIPSPEKEIQDLYLSLQNELQNFLQERLDNNKYVIIESRLTRKLIKRLFMPLIYGKTVITMARDIREDYGSLLSYKDYYIIAQLCHEFWIRKYPDIANLMKLINLVGWLCSSLDKPVFYSTPYFTTVQDYMHSGNAHYYVYDRASKKRRRVTLRVPTLNRDKRKTQVSTCANFIHQKDAFIAMKMVERLTHNMKKVYTVHDNFITTPVHATGVPPIYTEVFMEMGPPLRLINEFIHMNLLNQQPTAGRELYDSEPISGEYLGSLLRSLDCTLSKKDMLKWYSKIDEAVSCYESYVNTVCGEAQPQDGRRCHADKWTEFHSLLKNWESIGCNYSVHY